MNALEKMNALLAKEGRGIKYGAFAGETTDPLITLQLSDSLPSVSHLGDARAVSYPAVLISVVCSDYLVGYDLSEQIKAEIKAAQKATLQIVHLADAESDYDKEAAKHILKSKYKIIKI